MWRPIQRILPIGKRLSSLSRRSVLSDIVAVGGLSMSIASAQYDNDEKLAMARAAAAWVARSGVPDEMVKRLLDGEGRAAALLGIHRALRCIFTDSDRAARWIGAPNEAFDGASALDLMLADGLAGMRRVEAYLDAEIAS